MDPPCRKIFVVEAASPKTGSTNQLGNFFGFERSCFYFFLKKPFTYFQKEWVLGGPRIEKFPENLSY
jgi:hypothetical protein